MPWDFLKNTGGLYLNAEGAESAGAEGGGAAASGGAAADVLTDGQGNADPGGIYTGFDWRAAEKLKRIVNDPQKNKTLAVYHQQDKFVDDALGWRAELDRRERIPPAEASPEDWQKFSAKMPGYPAGAGGYAEHIQLPDLGATVGAEGEEPTPIQWDTALLESFYAEMHAQGIRVPQAQAILDYYARLDRDSTNIGAAEDVAARAENLKALQTRFGAQLTQKQQAARYYFEETVGEGDLGQKIWQTVHELGLDTDPDWIEFFSLQYRNFGEPPELLRDEFGGSAGIPTIEELDKAIGESFDLERSTDPSVTTEQRQRAFEKAIALRAKKENLMAPRRR